MRHDDYFRASSSRHFDGRQCRSNSGVVANYSIIDSYIQVFAYKNPLPFEILLIHTQE
jgi:hypothetical protein